jgi:hypothetical protein
MMSGIEGKEREIAKIERAEIEFEDHGIYVFSASFKGDNWGQGIGGRIVSVHDPATKRQKGTQEGMDFVLRFMEAAGVEQFSKLVGRTVYVLRDRDMIVGIAPLETEPGKKFVFDEIERAPDDPLAFPHEVLRGLRRLADRGTEALMTLEGVEREASEIITKLRTKIVERDGASR